jgi:hypothetical protein
VFFDLQSQEKHGDSGVGFAFPTAPLCSGISAWLLVKCKKDFAPSPALIEDLPGIPNNHFFEGGPGRQVCAASQAKARVAA